MPPRLGVVVGLKTEAKLASLIAEPDLIAISGATATGARRAVTELVARGVTHLLSFGIAAGLDPALRSGTLLLPREIIVDAERFGADPSLLALFGDGVTDALLHSDRLVTSHSDKTMLHASSGCAALDMESGVVAIAARDAGLPFAAVRAVCDAADRTLPPAARIPLRADGRVDALGVAGSIMRHPLQMPALILLQREVGMAYASLERCLKHARATFGQP